MNLTVNVYKYKLNNETDPLLTRYIYEGVLSGIYVTVRYPNGDCVSKSTGSNGSVIFNIDNSLGECIVYETVKNVIKGKTNPIPESYFDNLEVAQPVIDGSDIDQLKEVTSTTSRKYKITVGTSDKTLYFGHTVYKPIPCTDSVYSIQTFCRKTSVNSYYKDNILRRMDLRTGEFTELNRYNSNATNMYITALAYNPKEKLLYGIDLYNDKSIYRIDGNCKIVKVKDSGLIGMYAGDCDNNGNYFIGRNYLSSTSSQYRINLNQNSLNYLEQINMIVNMDRYTGERIDYMYDWKYNNNTKKLYSYCRTEYIREGNPQFKCNIIEMIVDLNKNTIIPNLIDTVQLQGYDNNEVRVFYFFGYDNGILYFIDNKRTLELCKIDMNKAGTKNIEIIKQLNREVIDFDNKFEANCATCSSCYKFKNNITANVFEYKINGAYDPVRTGYIKDRPLSNIYITVRDPNGFCTSKKTETNGSVNFPFNSEGEYIIYETVEDLIEDKTSPVQESYIDNLYAPQPIIDKADTSTKKEVTSTTPRKYKIKVELGSNPILEFGHVLYKPIPFTNKAYMCQLYSTKFASSSNNANVKRNILRQIDLQTGNYTQLKVYMTMDFELLLSGLAYNMNEKLIYAINTGYYCGLYRIDGDYNIVRITNENAYSGSVFGDFDDNGNYIFAISGLVLVFRENLNRNSFNYLDKGKMEVNMNEYNGQILEGLEKIDEIFTWKYNNNTRKLYTYGVTQFNSNSNPQYRFNIIEVSLDLNNNVITPRIIDTAQVIYTDYKEFVMQCSFGYDNGILYFCNNLIIYKVDITKSGPKVLEKVLELPTGLVDKTGIFVTDATNYSIVSKFDFGNAPENNMLKTARYRTTLSSGGPRHYISKYLKLGRDIYSEDDATIGESHYANDGCNIPLPQLVGDSKSYSLDIKCYNNTGKVAKLYGWLDFNCNGRFDINEFSVANIRSNPSYQTVTLVFNRPKDSISDKDRTFIRLRLTTDKLEESNLLGNNEDPRSLSTTVYTNRYGVTKQSFPAKDGEVEDWLVEVRQVANIIYTKTVDLTVALRGQKITYKLIAVNQSTVRANNVKVEDNLDEALTKSKFIEAYYIKNDNISTKTYVTANQLNVGVNIGSLGAYEKVIFTIVIEAK